MKYLSTGILILLSIVFVLSACDKIPDGIIDPQPVDYKILSIQAPSSFTFSISDSMITTSVGIQNVRSIGSIWCTVKSGDGTRTVNTRVDLLDNGDTQKNGDLNKEDNIFSGKFGMSKKFSNGTYQIEYFVEDNSFPSNIVKVGVQYFYYDNGQTNFPPVISNLSIASSVTRETPFTFSIKVNDPNGSTDIQSVFYRLFKPDGTQMVNSQGISEFPLFDDGNISDDGDQTAGDGIYSMKLTIPSSFPPGSWKFEFQAKDKGTPAKLSNLITFNLTVN